MKKILWRFFCGILVILLIFGGYLGVNYFNGNVHAVIPGEIYRSGQLNDKQLAHYTSRYHIKTLINLRGHWSKDPWYRVETHFVRAHQLHYYTFRFSSYELPEKSALRELVAVLQTVPKPLMFHCEGGADRTGMAAAISMILFYPNASLTQIKRQVSWRYNAISRQSVGYQVMRNYFSLFKANHLSSSRDNFMRWLYLPTPLKPYSGWFL